MKKWMYNTLMVIFAATFVFSAGMLLWYWVDSNAQAESYDALAQLVEQARPTLPEYIQPEDPQSSTDPTAEQQDPWVTVTDPETGAQIQVLPEYAQLYTMNNDLVGWIRIPDTKLNYPVMQTPNKPDYYLKRNFEKKRNAHGCIYAKEECDLSLSDNVTLYGHYMNDGSMFAPLGKYKKKSYWQDHPIIHFDTLTQRRTFEIFAVLTTTATEGKGFRYHNFIQAEDQEEFDSFVARCKKLSRYDTGITPQYGDKLITLSTCEYSQSNGRLVVVARLMDN